MHFATVFQLFKLHLHILDPYKILGDVLSENLISSLTAVRQMVGRWGGGMSPQDTIQGRLEHLVLYLKSRNIFPLLDKLSEMKRKGIDGGEIIISKGLSDLLVTTLCNL